MPQNPSRPPLRDPTKLSPGMHYMLALGVVGVALLARWLLSPWLGDHFSFTLTFAVLLPLAVLVRPGALVTAAIVGFTGSWLLFRPSEMTETLARPHGVVAMAILGLAVAATLLTAHVSRLSRDRAAENVDKARRQLELVTDATPALISYLDREQHYRFVNRHYEDWFGVPRDQVVGRTMGDVLGSEAMQLLAPHVERVLAGKPVRFEAEVPYRTGGTRWVDAHYVPNNEPSGATIGFYALVSDITERKQSEKALRDATHVAETLNRLGTALGVADLDLERIVQLVADEATALTGAQFGAFFYNVLDESGESYMLYALSGAPSEAFAKFPMPRNTEVFKSTFLGEGVVRSDDITLDPRYGKNAPYSGMPPGHLPVKSYLAVPVVSRSGDVLGGLFFGHERTGVFSQRHERIVGGVAAHAATAIDNARLYAQLQDSNQRFLQLAEHVSDVFWLSDTTKRKIIYVSPAYEAVWGRPRPSLYADPTSLLEAIHEDDRQRVRATLERQRRGEATSEEYRIHRADGELRWIWDRGYPVVDEAGNVVRVAGVAEDVTERKDAEQRLLEADQRKDEFLATLAHELRNPLAPIGMAVNILRNSRQDPERFERLVATIERQTHQLVRLVDDLLDVSRITRGKITLRPEPLDLGQVLVQVAEGTHAVCEDRGLRFFLSLPPAPLIVEADAARLAQIVGNLVSNACKYTDRGGQVRLVAERRGDEAVVRVQDTGIGIAPDQLADIFEMFAQVEGSRERAPGGLGIGLSLARTLVEMHGGSLEALSQGLGQGSEFIVRLPAAASSRPAGASGVDDQGANVPNEQLVAKSRVLVVDDNEDALATLVLFLELRGHEVRAAKDGPEAVAQADSFRPDLVLLDIGLPVFDGYGVARKIRREGWGRSMHLVAMTGWGQERDRQRALEAGFNAHVTKPASPELLDRLLQADRSAT